MNLTVKRILVVTILLIVSFILVGFTCDPASKVSKESSNEEIQYKTTIEFDDSLDVSVIQTEEHVEQDVTAVVSTEKEEINTEVYEITHYTSNCKGCTGITASGYNVRNTIYYGEYRIVAAPKHVPLHTKLTITYEDGTSINAIVLDRGGAIKTGKLDLLVKDKKEAARLGRQKVDVKFID